MPAAVSLNGEDEFVFETVKEPAAFYPTCRQWSEEALSNVKQFKCTVLCKPGIHSLKYYHISPNLTLERIVLYKQGSAPLESYLGPKESFYVMTQP